MQEELVKRYIKDPSGFGNESRCLESGRYSYPGRVKHANQSQPRHQPLMSNLYRLPYAEARQPLNPFSSGVKVTKIHIHMQVIVAIGSLGGVGGGGEAGYGGYGVGGGGFGRTSGRGSSNSFRYPLSRGMVEMGNLTIDFSSDDIENKCPMPKNRRKFEVSKREREEVDFHKLTNFSNLF